MSTKNATQNKSRKTAVRIPFIERMQNADIEYKLGNNLLIDELKELAQLTSSVKSTIETQLQENKQKLNELRQIIKK